LVNTIRQTAKWGNFLFTAASGPTVTTLQSLKEVGQRLHYVATDGQGQWLALLHAAS
jgi:hypothetical protein